MISTIDQITQHPDIELDNHHAGEQRASRPAMMIPSTSSTSSASSILGRKRSEEEVGKFGNQLELELVTKEEQTSTTTKQTVMSPPIKDNANMRNNENSNNDNNEPEDLVGLLPEIADHDTAIQEQTNQNLINDHSIGTSANMTWSNKPTNTISSRRSSSSDSSTSTSSSSSSSSPSSSSSLSVIKDDDGVSQDKAIDGVMNRANQIGLINLKDARRLSRWHPQNGNAQSTFRLKFEKTVIVHRDENGFGLRIKGDELVIVDHVHENSASWRAGVRAGDRICKVNGLPVTQMNHKEVVLMFKSSSRFIGLTLQTNSSTNDEDDPDDDYDQNEANDDALCVIGAHRAAAGVPKMKEKNLQEEPFPDNQNMRQKFSCKRPLSSSFRRNSSLSGFAGQNDIAGAGCSGNQTSNMSPRSSQRRTKRLPPPTSVTIFDPLPKPSLMNTSMNQESASTVKLVLSEHQKQEQLSEPYKPASLQNIERRRESVRTLSNNNVATENYHHQSRNYPRKQSISSVDCNNLKLLSSNYNVPKSMTPQVHEKQTTIESINSTGQWFKLRRPLEPSGSLRKPQRPTVNNKVGHIGLNKNSNNNNANNNFDSSSGKPTKTDSDDQTRTGKGRLYNLGQSTSTTSLPLVVVGRPNKENTNHNCISVEQKHQLAQQLHNNDQQQRHIALQRLQPLQTIQQVNSPLVNKRLEIIREFINTEKTHTDRLSWLDQLFYQPLKSGGLMSVEQLRGVFSCHRTLYKIHRTIYKVLLSANYGFYMEPLIGSALLEIFEGPLKRRLERAACTFCSAQATNGDLLNKLTRKDTKTGEFLAQVRSQQTVGRLGIKDLLASCFQRLTKYPLLLENLLKATPEKPPPDNDYLRSAHLPMNNQSHPTRISSRLELIDSNSRNNPQPHGASVIDCAEHKSAQAISSSANSGRSPLDDNAASCQQQLSARRQGINAFDEDIDSASNKHASRMLAICLAEEREFIERALVQSREILYKVNESIQVAESKCKLREIWKRTDKYPGVPLIDITNQHLNHDGMLTLRLSKRSFDVYMLLLNDYIIILTREGQDKYRLKFFTPDGSKFSTVVSNQIGSQQHTTVYSPVFVIDEHLTTRDAATDENSFYLLCKRKDDSRIYEFASRSPQERSKWRDKIQSAIDRQTSCKADRRQSSSTGESSLTKSSSEISTTRQIDFEHDTPTIAENPTSAFNGVTRPTTSGANNKTSLSDEQRLSQNNSNSSGNQSGSCSSGETKNDTNQEASGKKPTLAASPDGTQLVGTISYVDDDGIIEPSLVVSSRPFVDQAIRVSQVSQ